MLSDSPNAPMSSDDRTGDLVPAEPQTGGLRGRLRFKLLLALFSGLIALVLGELAVRLLAAMDHREPLVVSDTRVGWVLEPIPDAERGIEVIAACLGAMHDLTMRRGARLHALAHHRLYIPSPFSVPVWADFLRRTRAVDITERLRTPARDPNPIGYDGGHWSAEGHRRVASIIREQMDLPAPESPIRQLAVPGDAL